MGETSNGWPPPASAESSQQCLRSAKTFVKAAVDAHVRLMEESIERGLETVWVNEVGQEGWKAMNEVLEKLTTAEFEAKVFITRLRTEMEDQ